MRFFRFSRLLSFFFSAREEILPFFSLPEGTERCAARSVARAAVSVARAARSVPLAVPSAGKNARGEKRGEKKDKKIKTLTWRM